MGYIISSDQLNNLLSQQRSCVLLNSRQSKRPCRLDSWVEATVSAVSKLAAAKCLFLTSLGMNTWELAIHLVNRCGGKQVIIIPADLKAVGFDSIDEVICSFRLDTTRTSLAVLGLPEERDLADWPHYRDSFLSSLPTTLVPISLRPGGNLEELLRSTGNRVEAAYRTLYRKPVDRVRYDWSSTPVSPLLPSEWPFLTHWTRSADGPLSGQDLCEYYDSLLESAEYPGSAFNSLSRMLKENRIRASARFIRGEYPVVSFTSLHPREALGLMRWRRRYAYYSFEPYGIAVDTEIARQGGCREVRYASAADYEFLSQIDRPFFQNAHSAVADWRAEAEWRHVGDLLLPELPENAIRIVVYREIEARLLRARCPYQVVALVGD